MLSISAPWLLLWREQPLPLPRGWLRRWRGGASVLALEQALNLALVLASVLALELASVLVLVLALELALELASVGRTSSMCLPLFGGRTQGGGSRARRKRDTVDERGCGNQQQARHGQWAVRLCTRLGGRAGARGGVRGL